ncbi:MAG TPA: exodeoxyribonuclease III [Burkholderiales bacterium]|nr:exodeoxyribonuclease III [Burkholderiales bacterium]
MRLATWNVNSLKVRLPHLLDWAAQAQPDVICLQETKVEDAKFPLMELQAAGYQAVFAGQKSYNGVAILSRTPLEDVAAGVPGLIDDHRRVISASIGELRVISVYCPNGQAVGSDKYEYKLRWYSAVRGWLKEELARHPRLAILGDFNVAPEDRDVYNPRIWEGRVLCSEPERAAFRSLLELGLKDAFRLFEQPERVFSWWDYRMLAFRRNWGLRIDHILLSNELAPTCAGCTVDPSPRKLEQPSDHAPVIAQIR